jgi:hypothetical protein
MCSLVPRLCTLYSCTYQYDKARSVIADVERSVHARSQPWLASTSTPVTLSALDIQDLLVDLLHCYWYAITMGDAPASARIIRAAVELARAGTARLPSDCVADALPLPLGLQLRAACVAALPGSTPLPLDFGAAFPLRADSTPAITDASDVLWYHAMLECSLGAAAAAPHHGAVHTAQPAPVKPPTPPAGASLSNDQRTQLAIAQRHFDAAQRYLQTLVSKLRAEGGTVAVGSGGPAQRLAALWTARPWMHLADVTAALAHVQLNSVECGWAAVGMASEAKHLHDALKTAETAVEATGEKWRLGRPLLLLARTHHDASHAVTAEGLYRASSDSYGKAATASAADLLPGVAHLPMVARYHWVNSLRWHATLLEEWERREREAVVLRARADDVMAASRPSSADDGALLQLLPGATWGFSSL